MQWPSTPSWLRSSALLCSSATPRGQRHAAAGQLEGRASAQRGGAEAAARGGVHVVGHEVVVEADVQRVAARAERQAAHVPRLAHTCSPTEAHIQDVKSQQRCVNALKQLCEVGGQCNACVEVQANGMRNRT